MGVPGGREQYYQALYARLAARVTSAKTRERASDVAAFTNISIDQQPAFIVHVADQVVEHRPRQPSIWMLGAVVVLLAGSEIALNGLVDEVESALERQADELPAQTGENWYTTLNGLVQRCWIVDAVAFPAVGEASGQAVALVPVAMAVIAG